VNKLYKLKNKLYMAHTDIKAFLLVLAICFVLEAKPLNPKKVLYAINCGAPSGYKGANGIAYERVDN
jgi:hypothetical protein